MFTLIKNFRTLMIFTLFSGALTNSADGASTSIDAPEPVETTPEQQEAQEVVRNVAKKELHDVIAIQDYLKNNTSIKEGAKGPAVKDIQEILLFLNYDISFISSRTGNKVE
jgi:hypothetical protein